MRKQITIGSRGSKLALLYAHKAKDTILKNTDSSDGAPKLLAGTGSENSHLIVVVTSDRGLCGGFNTAITKLAKNKIKNLLNSNKTVKIFCVGKKGDDHLKREFNELIIDVTPISTQKKIDYEFAKKISKNSRELHTNILKNDNRPRWHLILFIL